MTESTSQEFEKVSQRFEGFPDHSSLARKIIDKLAEDKAVIGLFLSGSFALGKPDKFSDIDLYIIVEDGKEQEVIESHESLFKEVGKIGTLFPAIHIGDPNQIVVFYEEGLPIHVDYNYKTLSKIQNRAKDKNAIILLDRTGELSKLKEAWQKQEINSEPTTDDLQYFEDRFWGWCWYTHSKIQRGELWEARDATEFMRSSVLIKLAHIQLDLQSEGNRRLEAKFPGNLLRSLEETIPDSHNKNSYHQALKKLIDLYKFLFEGAVSSGKIQGIKKADRDYFEDKII